MKKVGLLLVLMMSAVLLAMITALVIRIFGSGADLKLPERPAVEENAGEVPAEEVPAEEVPAEEVPAEVSEEVPVEESAPAEGAVSEGAEAEAQPAEENPEAVEEESPPEEEVVEEEPDELSEEKKQEIIDKAPEFTLKKMKNDVWSGIIRFPDGNKVQTVLPIMKDPDSGEELLCDGYRKIICVEESDGELKPYAIKGDDDSDGAAMQAYLGLIEISDMLATAGWKKEGEEKTLPPEMTEILNNTTIPADRLTFIGQNEGRHIFRFSSEPQTDSNYEELYDLVSGMYRDPGSLEYIFIII